MIGGFLTARTACCAEETSRGKAKAFCRLCRVACTDGMSWCACPRMPRNDMRVAWELHLKICAVMGNMNGTTTICFPGKPLETERPQSSNGSDHLAGIARGSPKCGSSGYRIGSRTGASPRFSHTPQHPHWHTRETPCGDGATNEIVGRGKSRSLGLGR
jgi:hypothetical protein